MAAQQQRGKQRHKEFCYMGKKKHPEHVNHERWLVSYADFITLLFAFFVVLFASGQSDKAKQRKISAAITSAFAQMAMFDPHSATPALSAEAGSGASVMPVPIVLPMATVDDGKSDAMLPAALLQERVEQLIQKQLAAGKIHAGDMTLREAPDGLTLSLQEGGFFDSGSAELRPGAIAALLAIAVSLPATPIRIEGHTDDVPIHSALYASNWELSSARASAITRFLLEHSNVNPAQLSAAGYAEFHPVASNATAEGRARNRRVDIVFLQT
jgi:chemotaxis protein MotB